MKRQSIAEQTLRKQIKILQIKMDRIEDAIRANQQDLETTRNIRDQLEAEVYNLQKIRETASIRNKPANPGA